MKCQFCRKNYALHKYMHGVACDRCYFEKYEEENTVERFMAMQNYVNLFVEFAFPDLEWNTSNNLANAWNNPILYEGDDRAIIVCLFTQMLSDLEKEQQLEIFFKDLDPEKSVFVINLFVENTETRLTSFVYTREKQLVVNQEEWNARKNELKKIIQECLDHEGHAIEEKNLFFPQNYIK